MAAADISGAHATAKGLRHRFGVRIAMRTRSPRLVQKLLDSQACRIATMLGTGMLTKFQHLGGCSGRIGQPGRTVAVQTLTTYGQSLV